MSRAGDVEEIEEALERWAWPWVEKVGVRGKESEAVEKLSPRARRVERCVGVVLERGELFGAFAAWRVVWCNALVMESMVVEDALFVQQMLGIGHQQTNCAFAQAYKGWDAFEKKRWRCCENIKR